MRPLIITPLYPPAVGGAATYFGSIVPGLAARPEVECLTVLTERLPGEPVAHTDDKLRILRPLARHASCPPSSRWGHAQTYAHVQAWFALRLRPLIRRLGVDLVHFHTRYRGRFVYTALRRCGVPVLANLHDKFTAPAALVPVADWLLCGAEGLRRFATAGGFPAARLSMVPQPFRAPPAPSVQCVAAVRHRFALGDAPYVLFVGDITAQKGVYDLLEAYRRWRSDATEPRLVFAGPNWEGARFAQQIHTVPGAVYLGPVPHDDDVALVRGATVVVLPSRSEGLPYVMLEAVALGVTVIAPPGIPELDAHLGGSVLPEVSVPALIRALESAWTRRGTPTYPLDVHRPERVVDELVTVYLQVIRASTRRVR